MRLVKVFVAALVALLISSMGLVAPALVLLPAPPAAANVDQCAPPGVESASALPTNLAKAATGPGADKYTTATVEPLTAVNVNALGLSAPGTLTVGTLSDAPPSICINSAGQFTGFDNELLRAIAGRLGLNINFVGTEFSGLLAQVASRRFDVGSSSITTTDARRRTVGFTNGYDFGYFSLVVPSGSPITGFEKLAAGQRIGVVQGTVQEAYVIDTLHLQPVKFPDYNTVYASLKTRQIDAWVAPSQQAQGTVQPGDPAQIIENTFSLDNFVAWAVAKENQPLIDAVNSGLDAIIADGTWARLYSDWVPRALPPGWRPGSKAAPVPQLPDFAAMAASHQQPASHPAAPKSTLSQLADSFLDWDLYKQAVPDLFKTGLPNTMILTVSASVIGLVLGMALAVAGISRARWLRWPARVYTDIFRGLPEVVIILLIGLGVGPVVGGLTGNNPYPLGLFPHRSVLDNVTLAPRKLKRLAGEQARELGLEQLDRVGLRHKADVRPGTLSGGQQQRVAIARALAMSPQVMFFDEATSALDPELLKGILALIADLGADGMTMVVVTHEMGFARSTSDAVVFMDHGRVVESGPPEQIFETAETDRLRRFLSQVL